MTTKSSHTRTDGPELPGVQIVPGIPGVQVRPFRDASDYEQLSILMKASNRHDEIPWLPTVSNLRAEMENRSSLDPTHDVLLAEVDGRMIGMTGVERVILDGAPIYDIWGSVLPEFRHRGLGTALLESTLGRIRERALIEDPGVAVTVQGEAEEQEVDHRAMLARARFEPIRHFFLMRRATLDDVPVAPLPDGLEIRPVADDQRRTILTAEFEAFEDHWGHRATTEDSYSVTLGRPELDTSLWVVAWDGDQIAGVVENWIWAEENDELGVKRGWLERISVRRKWRRRGLARALTAASLVRLRQAGMKEGMLGVDSGNANGALGLYEGLGFEVHGRSAAYRRPLDIEG